MPKPDPALLLTCASCDAQKPAHAMGRYDATDRAFCLQREGKGGLCFRERVIERPVPPPTSIEAIVLAARTKGTTHAH